jgi:quinol monooxygenase YgiN
VIFIVVKFPVRPEAAASWLGEVAEFTAATRAEPGNLLFEWSRSVDDENEFVLVEAFRDAAAGAAHVGSDHFAAGVRTMSALVSDVPRIINVETPGKGWSAMAEVQPR